MSVNTWPKRRRAIPPIVLVALALVAFYAMGRIDGFMAGHDAATAERDNLWLKALGVALAPKEPV